MGCHTKAVKTRTSKRCTLSSGNNSLQTTERLFIHEKFLKWYENEMKKLEPLQLFEEVEDGRVEMPNA